jgi:maltose alpha-D-glucosyltransferase/alpha-amylase
MSEERTQREEASIPEIRVDGVWENVLEGKAREILQDGVLPGYLRLRRWFGSKGRTMGRISIIGHVPLSDGDVTVYLLFVKVTYAEGAADVVMLPIHYLNLESARKLLEESPQSIISRLIVDGRGGLLYDGAYNDSFHRALFKTIARGMKIKLPEGELTGRCSKTFSTLPAGTGVPESSAVLKAEQSNTSILFDNSYFLKLYRRTVEGPNPEAEIGLFLTDHIHFKGVAPLAGTLEYRRYDGEPVTIAMLQGYIPSHGDAWTYTLGELARFYDHVLTKKWEISRASPLPPSLYDVDFAAVPPPMQESIGGFYLEMVAQLGKRTGELHLALASRPEEPAFGPEPYSILYQRSVYQSMSNLTEKVFSSLERNIGRLAGETGQEALRVLDAEQDILGRLHKFLDCTFSAMRIRIHGDYHLGQVLYTGNDFIIIDFEGEPARTMSERRIKHSPLRDVVGMIRSFHYAAHAVLLQRLHVRSEDVPLLDEWAEAWYRSVSGVFLHAYLNTVAESTFIPVERQDLEIMLDAFLLEKAIYELGYELDNRPGWVRIPLRGIRGILRGAPAGKRTIATDQT